MRFMQRSKDSLAKWLSAILPVVIVGLVGLFAVTVIRDYGRETAAARQTLLEKGSVLIPCSRIRLARRHGDAHASCAAAGLT